MNKYLVIEFEDNFEQKNFLENGQIGVNEITSFEAYDSLDEAKRVANQSKRLFMDEFVILEVSKVFVFETPKAERVWQEVSNV